MRGDNFNMSSKGAVIVIGAGLSGKVLGKYILEAFLFEMTCWMRHLIVDPTLNIECI
jgi:hypothetical protein